MIEGGWIMFLRFIHLYLLSMAVLALSACGGYNQNDLLTDNAKVANCPPGCASAISVKPELMNISIDSGTYSIKNSADNRLDITGLCTSPYSNTEIYLQMSTGIPATSANARTTNYYDLNTGTNGKVLCVNGKFAASVRLGSLTAPAAYYMTAMIRAVVGSEVLYNSASGGTSYIQFTVTQ